MSFASLLKEIQTGKSAGPVTRALANWDGVITKEAVEVVNSLRLKDLEMDRSSGKGRFRGSLLGSCDRMQMLSFLGYDQEKGDDTGREIMRDGTYRHYFWQEVGLSAGFLTEIEAKCWYEPWHFGGQLDGVMAVDSNHPGRGGFELKTTNERTFSAVTKAGAPLLKHLKQVGAYCEATGLDWFSVVYETRSYQVQWKEFVVQYDDELRDITHGQINELLGWEAMEELPPVKEGYPKDSECTYWCSYSSVCPTATF